MIAISPSTTILQVSGDGEAGQPRLSVLVKRTYKLSARGMCELAEQQLPLGAAIVDAERRNLLLQDADIYPEKPLTDVVVLGHAYPPSAARSFVAELLFGPFHKRLAVTGDRRVSMGTGELLFSNPEPFERVPLSYDRAYGGLDAWAEEHVGNPYEKLAPYVDSRLDARLHSPHLYPRNPSGKGYLIHASRASVERVELPNIEDPDDRLTPDRLAAGSPSRWPHMPLPWGTSWMSHAAFPRIAFTGASRPFEPMSEPFAEVQRGFCPQGFPRLGYVTEVFQSRFWNGASLGLSVGPLGEGAWDYPIELRNLHPTRPTLSFRLPQGAPKIWTDGRDGKLNETAAVLHHVVIEPDEDRVSVLWRGSAPALRRYALPELLAMPLRVEW